MNRRQVHRVHRMNSVSANAKPVETGSDQRATRFNAFSVSGREFIRGACGAILIVLLLAMGAMTTSVTDFNLWWHTVAGGGGHAASVDYNLDGSIGQPAASALSSADFRLAAGFWPGISAEAPVPTVTDTPPATPTTTATGSPPPAATPTASPTESPPPAATPTVTPTGEPALVVNTTDDANDGECNTTHCSLREAINAANAHAGPDTITFNIPDSDARCSDAGVCTIQPTSLLPFLTDGDTTIDGYSQPGARAGSNPTLKIVLDGHNNGSFSGLAIRSANNVIRGLVIQRFTPFSAVHIEGAAASDNRLQGNFIGTDATGTQPRGNCTPPTSCAAVWIRDGAQDNFVGPDNLIAFNGQGVWIVDAGTRGNTIARNRIHSNALKGIRLYGGGNDDLAPPVINLVSPNSVSGTACANCTIEVFSDTDDEGRIYEGVTTADAGGDWVLTKAGGLAGPNVTATATDAAGNTSEFSAPAGLPTLSVYLPLVHRSD